MASRRIREFVIAKMGGPWDHLPMIPSCLKFLRRPAFPMTSLLAVASFALAGCLGAGKKGEASLVVSTVDPAVAAKAGRVDMTTAEPVPDYSASGIREYAERALGRELDIEPDEFEQPEETGGRTEITPATREYKVATGDSLWLISRKFDTSIDAIKRANGMSGDELIAGKTIRIPKGAGNSAAQSESDEEGPSEVVATPLTATEAAEKAFPETLPSGVVPPSSPRRSASNGVEDDDASVPAKPVNKTETTIGEDGFLRFSDDE